MPSRLQTSHCADTNRKMGSENRSVLVASRLRLVAMVGRGFRNTLADTYAAVTAGPQVLQCTRVTGHTLTHPTTFCWQMAIENGHSESRPAAQSFDMILEQNASSSRSFGLLECSPCRLAADSLAWPCLGRLESEEHLTGAGKNETNHGLDYIIDTTHDT